MVVVSRPVSRPTILQSWSLSLKVSTLSFCLTLVTLVVCELNVLSSQVNFHEDHVLLALPIRTQHFYLQDEVCDLRLDYGL